MPNWDVFHSDRLEVDRDLPTSRVRSMLARGEAREDDLVRPAGTTDAWKRIGEMAELMKPGPDKVAPQAAGPPAAAIPTAVLLDDLDELRKVGEGPDSALMSVVEDDRQALRDQMEPGSRRPGDSDLALAVASPESDEPEFDPLAEDAEAAGFTFAARGGQEKEEDLDLAAMVDVAFQLILFFLVTASTVFFKSLEIPPPDPEKQKSSQQAVAQRIEDLQNDNIIVEVDPHGQFLVDHDPVAPDNLAAKMRSIREVRGATMMLLMADRLTPHKYVVMALDAANEISLGIRVGRSSEATE